MTLNPGQREAVDDCIEALRGRRWHVLAGAAGTGKTTVVQAVVPHLRGRITLAAPTHKAVGVLKSGMLSNPNVEAGTIHSLLRLRPKIVRDNQIFVPDDKPLAALGTLILDECSMLGRQMMRNIRHRLAGCPVLFVGDMFQLPPVNEESSDAFNIPSRSELLNVVRQSDDNPIRRIASLIRNSIFHRSEMDLTWFTTRAMCGKLGIWPTRGDELDRLMQRLFTSDEFRNDPNHARYLCWTNPRVREVNARVRRWIYGATETPFVAGELALVRKPLVVEGQTAIGTNTEVRVRDIRPGNVRGVQTWHMTVATGDGVRHTIHLARDRDEYERVRLGLRAECVEAESRDRDVWELYHAFQNLFVDVQHSYAMTVHCAQGSTFRYAFVDIDNCLRREGDRPEEAKRLFYTAVTRPSQVLFPCIYSGSP